MTDESGKMAAEKKPRNRRQQTKAAVSEEAAVAADAAPSSTTSEERKKRREIGGSIPYTQSIGVFERALNGLIESERPESFRKDFMSTVLNVSGGASMPVIPILKRAGLIDQAGHPTELYAEFQGDSTRPQAALKAMRNAFDDIFQRNKFAHKADGEKIKDIIRSVTGLPKNDRIVGWMLNTFQAFQKYIGNESELDDQPGNISSEGNEREKIHGLTRNRARMALAYNINIVLPNNASIETYNRIFRSIRENLLDE